MQILNYKPNQFFTGILGSTPFPFAAQANKPWGDTGEVAGKPGISPFCPPFIFLLPSAKKQRLYSLNAAYQIAHEKQTRI